MWGCTYRKWQGWGSGHRIPLSVAAGARAQSLTPTQPFPALEKKNLFLPLQINNFYLETLRR